MSTPDRRTRVIRMILRACVTLTIRRMLMLRPMAALLCLVIRLLRGKKLLLNIMNGRLCRLMNLLTLLTLVRRTRKLCASRDTPWNGRLIPLLCTSSASVYTGRPSGRNVRILRVWT